MRLEGFSKTVLILKAQVAAKMALAVVPIVVPVKV